jgi:hypothetical protein
MKLLINYYYFYLIEIHFFLSHRLISCLPHFLTKIRENAQR